MITQGDWEFYIRHLVVKYDFFRSYINRINVGPFYPFDEREHELYYIKQ